MFILQLYIEIFLKNIQFQEFSKYYIIQWRKNDKEKEDNILNLWQKSFSIYNRTKIRI